MARILIVYGTHDGQTALVAHRMAEVLRSRGHTLDIRDARALPSSFSPRVFDGVLVGSSVRWGRHQPAVREFARKHVAVLDRLPAWFFSVSLAAADRARGLGRAGERIREFGDETGWWPERAQVFGGALRYTTYGFFLRLAMRLVAFFAHLPTDPSLDHDLTDWANVRAFVRDFDHRLAPPSDPLGERSELAPLKAEALATHPPVAADEEAERAAAQALPPTTAPDLAPVVVAEPSADDPAEGEEDSEANTQVSHPVHH